MHVVGNNEEQWLTLGRSRLRDGDLAGATSAFRQTIALCPGHVRAHLGLSECTRRSETVEAAIEQLVASARDMAEHDDFDGALALYARALDLDPEALGLHLEIADVEQREGDVGAAVRRLRSLSEIFEDLEDAAGLEAIEARMRRWRVVPPRRDPAAREGQAPPVRLVPTHELTDSEEAMTGRWTQGRKDDGEPFDDAVTVRWRRSGA